MKHLIQPLAWGVTLASILAAASALALSLATPMAAAATAAPHHLHSAQEALPVSAGHATDAALREGMSRVRDALQSAGMAPDDQAAAVLAGEIEAAGAYLVANCRLPEAADTTLHGVLGNLLGAADRLRGPGAPRDAALRQARSALARYQQLFDAPHWR
ncbi:DnrO protein [Stutzerimonas balearica]|jgi:hypothetical protein|uniref:DnrO protein n=2 Tax=Stutzerimonas balearica TaxID=74829 RepID=UPI001F29E098|nr:DnrO protein [Stutzerimonas balearica]MCF6757929.1 DnrO protein [Stutzerimonas balearica]